MGQEDPLDTWSMEGTWDYEIMANNKDIPLLGRPLLSSAVLGK